MPALEQRRATAPEWVVVALIVFSFAAITTLALVMT
jgi:hypothetical protein